MNAASGRSGPRGALAGANVGIAALTDRGGVVPSGEFDISGVSADVLRRRVCVAKASFQQVAFEQLGTASGFPNEFRCPYVRPAASAQSSSMASAHPVRR